MKKYLSFFRIRFTNGLQYRAAALAGVFTQYAWGFMTILMFYAFYETNPNAFPMKFEQLTSYIWLQQAFIALFMCWFWDNEIFTSISNGNIAYELCRPMDLYNILFIRNMAMRLSKAVLRCFPILLLAFFLPKPFRLTLSPNILTFALFLLTGFLAFVLVVAYSMLIYIATFYTISPLGVRIVALSLTEFLSGAVIPIPFFPEGLRQVLNLLPFASMQNLPLLIYSGAATDQEIFYGILLQLFWVTTLILLGKLWLKKALNKFVIQGG